MLFFGLALYAQVYLLFLGNKSFSDEELYKAVGIELPWWRRLFKKEPPKVDERLLPMIHLQLKSFYKDQGFWDANITLERNQTAALFYIDEKEPIRISALSVTSDFPITHLIPFQKGERFVASRFGASKQKITQALLEAGYCSYHFDPKAYIYRQKKEAYLVYSLQKNDPCIIGSVSIHGLSTIDERVVYSHIYIRPNDPFYLELIKESYYRLHSLQYFRFIHIDYSKKIDNAVLVDISLKERKRRNVYRAGIGYDTKNGVHASLSYKHLNYHQSQPSVDIFYSDIKKGVEFSLFYPSLPWFDPLYPDLVIFAGFSQNIYEEFSQKEHHLFLKLLKDLYILSASLELGIERIRIYDTPACISARSYTLFSPSLELLWDKRDSKLRPKKGFFLQDRFSISHSFVKNRVRAGVYIPLALSGYLVAKADFGTIFARSIPPNKLFYAGGVTSNRAHGYRQITALDNRCAIGGKTILQTTLEPRFHITKNFWGALFWDRTYLSSTELHVGPYKDGVGAGALIDTPMGELKLYFGFDPKDPAQNAIHFYLGATF
jgi:translocation and assembly module TamA